MFYESVRAAWSVGKVRVILPAVGFGDRAKFEAGGLIGLKAAFLSRGERDALAELATRVAEDYRAREEAISKMATMSLLDRVGEVVAAIKLQHPSPVRLERMSKSEIGVYHKLSIVQDAQQAEEAAKRAGVLKAWGDDMLAEAMFEWAEAIRRGVEIQERSIEDAGYQEWLREPYDWERT